MMMAFLFSFWGVGVGDVRYICELEMGMGMGI